MVDAFVSYAVQKLGDFLIQEVNLRLSLREEVQWLRNELLFMQSFLKDAEEKQVGDQRVQQWVFEINDFANDAVAILETYSLEAGEGDGDGLASRLKLCACICRKETKFYNVSKEIQSLKQRILDISRKRETYGIRDINNVGEGPNNYRPNNQRSGLRRTTSYMDKQDQIFVGFKDVVERLLAELVKAEPRRTVISIYGMGGLGKTTLAKNLYHSPSLTNIFDARAWVCVSQQYNTMDLLKNIIKSIQGRDRETLDLLEKMTDVTDLEKHLQDLLKEKKYLVVVDDVWQREAWQSLERALPDSNNGSRVIITTRKADVAKRADDNGLPHNLRFLTKEESWDLFRRKLLDVKAMIPAMETLARDMVGKCGGLPLAIAALSGLLSHKRGLEEWERVKAHLWRHMKDDFIAISDILSLSYNDLPTVLKHCFLYFGIFPEDRQINAKNLMWLWMADGLIPRGEESMEDVAQDFLNELIRRSLVQVVETSWEEVTECRIHDLLRDLAIQKASEVNFFDTYGPRKHSISSSCRRHTIHGQGERYLTLDFSKLNLRSVTFFDQKGLTLDRIKFRNMFQHLYVLYLENGSNKFTLPDAIGSLYSLRYLSFTGSCDIPSSIGNLKNLLTLHALDEDADNISRLPPEIANLVNLRHLVVAYSEPLQHINKLTSLQVLRGIRCDQWRDVNPVDLVNLRELSMYGIEKSYSLNNISSLKSLSTLELWCEYGESFPALEFLSCCQKLQKLRLLGRIEKLPPFPNSITMMTLSRSYLKEDPMPILGMLPNLRNLELLTAYSGKEITCSDNSFSQLEFLRLVGLFNLERWHLATSAMPLIKGLRIDVCPKLNEIPERMKDEERLEITCLFDNSRGNKSQFLNTISFNCFYSFRLQIC
ncbi:disease resistance protein RPP13-like [Lycium ferocissimum]|uniref:disease resistance protein RPP13-like n=1 Tax=Lycium ferocissimum TaxID=112874 RepID=UPI002816765E|nr:disease resistance protein RPP13-like [Lycium ferocissimum]